MHTCVIGRGSKTIIWRHLWMFPQAFCRKHPDLLRSREDLESSFIWFYLLQDLWRALQNKSLEKKEILLTSRVSFFKCFLISEDVPSSSDLTSFLAFLDSSSNLTFLTSLSSFSVDAGRFRAPPFLNKEGIFIFQSDSRKDKMLIEKLKIQRLRINISIMETCWKRQSKRLIKKWKMKNYFNNKSIIYIWEHENTKMKIFFHLIENCIWIARTLPVQIFRRQKKLAASNLPFQVFEGFIGT